MPDSAPHSVIVPVRGWVPMRLGELWHARDLLLLFARRDVSVRYRQTVLGIGWAAVQPLMMTVVFAVFLGTLARFPSEGLPYAVFALSGLVPWTFFSNAVTASSESLVGSSSVITKVYFARLVLPLGRIAAWLPDFLIATVVLVGAIFLYDLTPKWTTVLVPAFALAAMLVAAAVGIVLAPLNVGYRDVRYLTLLLMQAWMFATPVVYPLSRVPERWQFIYSLNPMAGIVGGFRWAVLGVAHPPWDAMVISLAASVLALVASIAYFRRVEHRLADVI